MSYQALARGARPAGFAASALLALAGSASASTPTGGVATTGAATTSAIGSAGASTGGSRHLGDRVLRRGMRGHDVRVLQAYLTIVGFPTTVDGVFGSQTKRGVIAFQRSHGFAPTGVVTRAVELSLRAAVARFERRGAVGRTRINPNGTATAPANAPPVVKAVVAAANRIIHKPYRVGGGHGRWNDSAYDCSGAVSFALHGGGLLSSPEDSTGFESYGSRGPGRWITIYADAGHAFMVVAGRAFDTANFGGPNIPAGSGPRWRWNPTGNLADGGNYVVRHPPRL
jgi:peptidoglycan hydrolase-like protein with peptidoglycan-binding domain